MEKKKIKQEYFLSLQNEEKARVCKDILLGLVEMEDKEKNGIYDYYFINRLVCNKLYTSENDE